MYYVQYIRTNYVTYRQIFFARELLEYVPVKYLKCNQNFRYNGNMYHLYLILTSVS